jgi:hypothetical protein
MALMTALVAPAHAASELNQDFGTPPAEAGAWTWWHWQNGHITREGITADLEAMKRAGLRGATIFHVGQINLPNVDQVEFMSDEWFALMRFAAEEAARLDMKLGFHNCPGWSASGGPWVPVEHSMQQLTWSKTTVEGPVELTTSTLPQPELNKQQGPVHRPAPSPGSRPAPQPELNIKHGRARGVWDYYRDIAVIAVPENDGGAIAIEDVIVLGEKGLLPTGKWRVYRVGHTTIGKTNNQAPIGASGLECDKMRRESVKLHFDAYPKRIIDNAGDLAGKSLDLVIIDSYEARGRNDWTPGFEREFASRRGYDPLPWLPALFGETIGSKDRTQRFKGDMQRTVGDLLAENYYGYFSELAHDAGLRFGAEPYGGPYNSADVTGGLDLPMAEFWQKPHAEQKPGSFRERGWHNMPTAISAGRVNGNAVIGAEAFTAMPTWARWEQGPYELKSTGDRAYAAGINQFHFHTYSHQPWLRGKPGFVMGRWGSHFSRNQTWWETGRAWFDYLARCQFLLQRGRFVGDVLILSNAVGHGWEFWDFPDGYAGDMISEKLLQENVSVRDGDLLLPDGKRYRLLVLPNDPTLTPATARKVRELVQAGARVMMPKAPERSPSMENYPAADAEVKAIGEELAKSDNVLSTRDVRQALQAAGIAPDVIITGPKVLWIHRRLPEGDLYFISNQALEQIETRVSFRIDGPAPELWHPETGRLEKPGQVRRADGRTELTLSLADSGSVFVMFPDKPTPGALPPQPEPEQVALQLTGPWQVQFPPNWGAPEQVKLDKLISWTEHPNEGVRYFSGTAAYRTEFVLDRVPDNQSWLDLGEVKNLASVELNGEDLGTLWTPPFRVEITGKLRKGKNQLTVRITNYWRNRLIGDEQQPADVEWGRKVPYPPDPKLTSGRRLQSVPEWFKNNQPRPSSNRYTFTVWSHFEKDAGLIPAGLLGPVRILMAE